MNRENAVLRSIEIIESRIAEKLTLQNIAASVYFSKYHYSRMFSEIIGESVMEYVQKRRIELGAKALRQTDKTVLDIALSLGFETHEGFTRAFKMHMGLTPRGYRKQCFNTTSYKNEGERFFMTYSKNIDTVVRELRTVISMGEEAAQLLENPPVNEYALFWHDIKDKTYELVNEIKSTIKQVESILENSDEITKRFVIVKAVEDVAFYAQLLSFNVRLTVARGLTESRKAHSQICDKFICLAKCASVKAVEVTGILNELSQKIFEGIRQAVRERLHNLKEETKRTASSLEAYPYLRDEVEAILKELTDLQDISVIQAENFCFRLKIISVAADLDVFRCPNDRETLNGVKKLLGKYEESYSFFESIIKPHLDEAVVRTNRKQLEDIAFQGNIFLFYIRGEVDKLGSLLESGQRDCFSRICSEINKAIELALGTEDSGICGEICEILNSVHLKMEEQADMLKEKDGAVRFLSDEIRLFMQSVEKL